MNTLVKLVVSVFFSTFLVSCAVPRSTTYLTNRLEVISPLFSGSGKLLPDDWAIEPDGEASKYLAIVNKENVPALKVTNGDASLIAVRRIQSILIATPYLQWAWYMSPHGAGNHPVRLIIGFHGGNPESASWGGEPFSWLGSALPPHDRSMGIVFGDSALKRGNMSKMPKRSNVAAIYTARGGAENSSQWWLEDVDLSQLYAKAWPGDDLDKVKIVFIGVAAAGGFPPTPGFFSEILISR